jgi:hypothetical protein
MRPALVLSRLFDGDHMRSLRTEELELVAGAGVTPDNTKRQQANNGLGNGDQIAPGNSLATNQAENNLSNSGGTQGGFSVTPN